MSTDGTGSVAAASSLYAQSLHAHNYRAHVAHGRVESGVLAVLRRKIHELSQPESGADCYNSAKLSAARQLQEVADKLEIVPGDVEAWASLKDRWSAENSGIRPGVLSAILASMLQVDAATEAPSPAAASAAQPSVDNFLPTFVRRSTMPGAAAAQEGQQPGGGGVLARSHTYHASRIGDPNAPSSLFGQAMHLWRSEQGEAGVVQLLQTKFGELVARQGQSQSAEDRAQAQELQSALERMQADSLSGAAWHTLSSSHFAAPNSGLSSVQFSMQAAQPLGGGGVQAQAAGSSAAASSSWQQQGNSSGWTPPAPGAMSRGGYAQYATNEGQ